MDTLNETVLGCYAWCMTRPHDKNDPSTSEEQVSRALEYARELAREPYRLSEEQRARITAGVLSRMGYGHTE